MCQLIDDRWVVARKDHHCNGCGGTISKGTSYLRQRVVDGRDIWTYKAHELCAAIEWRIQRDYHLDCTDSIDDHEVREQITAIFTAWAA